MKKFLIFIFSFSSCLDNNINYDFLNIDQDSFDVETVREIHSHIDEVEKHLLFFHDDVEKAFSRWRGEW